MAMYLHKHAPAPTKIKFELSVINMEGNPNRVRGDEVTLVDYGSSKGWEAFITQKDLIDLGFIKNNRILVKAYVEILSN